MIMQLEIPLEVVEYVKELAVSLGKLVIVDPAPAVEGIPDHFWKGIDFIKPNETELAILTGQERKNREELEEGARQMLAKGVKGVLVSLGGDGCLLVQEEESRFFPANKVKAVDTTAAGDCFTAGFALALSQGRAARRPSSSDRRRQLSQSPEKEPRLPFPQEKKWKRYKRKGGALCRN